MPAARTLREQLNNFATFLLEEDVAITVTPNEVADDRVTWIRRPGADAFLAERAHHSIANYRAWVENGEFSIMLYDGSLLQLSYEFDGDHVTSHRLAYVPCPYKDPDNLLRDGESLNDFFDYYDTDVKSVVQLLTTLRFDYDPVNAAPGHPAAHFTLNSAETRIACAGPLAPDRFIRFIFSNFYPSIPQAVSYFSSLPKSGQFTHVINQDDRSELHLSWAE